jgi:alanine-alpha-ketoisovalerate/valine-pyruvate aminotransferase
MVVFTMTKPVRGKPFQPGQSGNPGGRLKMPDALKARIAKLASKDAVDVLQDALKSNDEKVRIQAAGMLLDRAWGKAITPSDVKVTNGDLNAQHLQALQDRIRTKPALVAGTDVEKAG